MGQGAPPNNKCAPPNNLIRIIMKYKQISKEINKALSECGIREI